MYIPRAANPPAKAYFKWNVSPRHRHEVIAVMSAVMAKALKPTLISGNAHPHAIAAVRANTTTHMGRWNMDVFVINFSKNWCKNSDNSAIITIFVPRFNSICDY